MCTEPWFKRDLTFSSFLIVGSGKLTGIRKTYTSTSPPLFLKGPCDGEKKWPVPVNLPFFAVEAYAPGGGVQNQAEKKSKNAFRPAPVPKSPFPANQQKGVYPYPLAAGVYETTSKKKARQRQKTLYPWGLQRSEKD